jgi:hypothetical protein
MKKITAPARSAEEAAVRTVLKMQWFLKTM